MQPSHPCEWFGRLMVALPSGNQENVAFRPRRPSASPVHGVVGEEAVQTKSSRRPRKLARSFLGGAHWPGSLGGPPGFSIGCIGPREGGYHRGEPGTWNRDHVLGPESSHPFVGWSICCWCSLSLCGGMLGA